MDHGIKASNNSDLRTAYAINAFYDHFMTDMFSASHLRVPRRQLHDKYGIGDMYTAAQMHNEDGKYGLWVTNALGDVWQAFGDGEQQTNSSNADNWQRCLQAVKASVDEVKNAITTKSVIATTDYQILKIKPEVFPPGAVVYSKSKKTDYTVKMEVEDANPWPIQCVVMEFPSKQKALVIPKWLKDKTDPELPDLVVWLRGFDDDNIENILKPLYRINTKSVVSPSGDMKGTQSYPLFIIADGKLYVRTTDDISSPLANQYITAEYNYDNTTLYDSNSAPAVTERLQGRQQGYPAPP
ncbi:MAG: hypothetical protein HY295_06555 [Thaumarchaeota archaeon]|nr:hypothetical protein [Nitrososphaerota archaeon]